MVHVAHTMRAVLTTIGVSPHDIEEPCHGHKRN